MLPKSRDGQDNRRRPGPADVSSQPTRTAHSLCRPCCAAEVPSVVKLNRLPPPTEHDRQREPPLGPGTCPGHRQKRASRTRCTAGASSSFPGLPDAAPPTKRQTLRRRKTPGAGHRIRSDSSLFLLRLTIEYTDRRSIQMSNKSYAFLHHRARRL